ncbi:MAG: topoisomerase DNA-binding C4 zinc finger domain-containing protein [Candidatus Diapherotrites archaeon]
MKGLGQTMVKSALKCAVCGKKATEASTLNIPTCKEHQNLPTKTPQCPQCEGKMSVKAGKNGGFWRCDNFPICFGTRNLLNPDEEQDIL